MSLRLAYSDDLPEIVGKSAKSLVLVSVRRSKRRCLNCVLEDV